MDLLAWITIACVTPLAGGTGYFDSLEVPASPRDVAIEYRIKELPSYGFTRAFIECEGPEEKYEFVTEFRRGDGNAIALLPEGAADSGLVCKFYAEDKIQIGLEIKECFNVPF